MTDSVTFSALVDEVAKITARGVQPGPHRQLIIGYARATLRECHALSHFVKDLVEDEITATASPHIWTRPKNFRKMQLVEYPFVIFPIYRQVGKKLYDSDYYYYSASTYYVFAGVSSGDTIKLAYFTYGAKFNYYEVNNRPAYYDDEDKQWYYLDANGEYQTSLNTTAEEEAAQAKVTDWLLDEWYAVVREGVLAKTFKNYGDEKRSSSSFALYKSLQPSIILNEAYEGAPNV